MSEAKEVEAQNQGIFVMPIEHFRFAWNGVIISFSAGIPTLVDPHLLQALKDSGQPFV